jgi:hypothetical protein
VGGPAGRDVGGGQRHEPQPERRGHEGERVPHIDVVQEAGQDAREGESGDRAQDHADQRQPAGLPHYQPHHVQRLGAQGESDPHLPATLGHCVGYDAIDPDPGQHQREPGEDREQHHEEPAVGHGARQVRGHGLHGEHRETRVHVPDGPAHRARQRAGRTVAMDRQEREAGGMYAERQVELRAPLGLHAPARDVADHAHDLVPLGRGADADPAADRARAVAPWSDRLSIVEVVPESAAAMPAPAVLIRPDGYVLWSARGPGAGTADVAEVATAWLGAPA